MPVMRGQGASTGFYWPPYGCKFTPATVYERVSRAPSSPTTANGDVSQGSTRALDPNKRKRREQTSPPPNSIPAAFRRSPSEVSSSSSDAQGVAFFDPRDQSHS